MSWNETLSQHNAERFEAHGFRCAVQHTSMGHACGYVLLPNSHPWATVGEYEWDVPAEVHGGVTFRESDGDLGTWIGWDDAHPHKLERSPEEETRELARQAAEAAGE